MEKVVEESLGKASKR